jgi:ATP-binding cassette subfamily B protein
MKEKIRFWLRVLAVYKPFRRVVVICFGLLMLSQLVGLAGPYFFGRLFTLLQQGAPLQKVMGVAVLTLVFALMSGSLNTIRDRKELRGLDFVMKNHLEMLVLRKLMSLSIGQHRNQHSGITMSVISEGENNIVSLATMILYQMVPSVMRIVIVIGALLWMGWQVGLIVLLSGILFIFLSQRINTRFAPKVKTFRDKGHAARKVHYELVGNMPLVQTHAQEDRMCAEYQEKQVDWSSTGREIFLSLNWWNWIRMALLASVEFAIITVGVFLVYRKVWPFGTLATVVIWSGSAINGLQNLLGFHREMMQQTSGAKKCLAILDVPPAITQEIGAVKLPKLEGRIEFKDVTFGYAEGSYIELDDGKETPKKEGEQRLALERVTFTIEPGQSVAFVGSSGAGKSTLINLILRGYDPTFGAILIDGHDLRSLDLQDFRRQIGVVEQDVTLFDMSMRENITFGMNGHGNEVTSEQMQEIARKTGIDLFYDRLTAGFETIIGEKGVKLSGGEQQRVGIARALIKGPSILIFDEATCHLDTVTERIIQDSIKGAAKGLTTIIVAHRLSTVQHVAKIIVLDHGRVVGEGNHGELMKSCPTYQELVAHQIFA